MTRELGQGEFGVVMEASAVNIGKSNQAITVAVKMLKAKSSVTTSAAFVDEAERTKDLDHTNVIKLLGVVFRSEPLLIVLEYMENGDLKTYLRHYKDDGFITVGHMLKLSADASSGFQYLQEKRYVHRDLAARNVLLDGKFTAKIGDFGLWEVVACINLIVAGMARKVFASEYYQQSASSTSSWALPIRWMAPESYLDGTWDLRSDVWMFGVLLWGLQPMLV